MRKIKIAQIGLNTNSHSVQIFGSLKRQSDIFEVVGYVLPENERERLPQHLHILEGCKELTLDEVLNNPEIEAVAIETDEIYTTKYALLAAEHGKHIHMEKPGGIELCDFEKLISIVKKNGTVFHTGYMYRYNPNIIALLERIKNGELGEIISVEAQMSCKHTPQNRQWLEDFPGGMMFFLGCHLIDLILQIKGMPDNIIPLNRCTGTDGVTAEDFGMAVLEYKNGVCTAMTSANEKGGFARRHLTVHGSKETVKIWPLEMFAGGSAENIYSEITSFTDDDWSDRGTTVKSDNYNRYDAMMAAFAKMAAGEIENPYTYDYELELYKTVLKSCGK